MVNFRKEFGFFHDVVEDSFTIESEIMEKPHLYPEQPVWLDQDNYYVFRIFQNRMLLKEY